jgi:hypothetical protein
MGTLLVSMVILVLAVQLLRLLWPKGRGYERERREMPRELATATLVKSEGHLRMQGPRPLHGTPDQVFLTTCGMLIPIDSKTRRHRTLYTSDILQVSLYARLLAGSGFARRMSARVASHGYIRFMTPEGVFYRRVRVLPDAAINQWYDRRHALEQGAITPGGPSHPTLCDSCGQRQRCPRVPRGRSLFAVR